MKRERERERLKLSVKCEERYSLYVREAVNLKYLGERTTRDSLSLRETQLFQFTIEKSVTYERKGPDFP